MVEFLRNASRPTAQLCSAAFTFVALTAPTVSMGQSSAAPSEPTVEEVVVTGLKNAGTTVQDAPLTVTALGPEQLDRAHVRSVNDLSALIPNVRLTSNTSYPGFANFGIRGMAIYGTVPSTTPVVGIFVDEVYLGTPVGSGWNTFDLAGIEVLRGPQGLFFGRNVTAGAILVRTTEPTREFSAKAGVSLETGGTYTGSAVVSGPLNEKWAGKVAAYHSYDGGYFKNRTLDRDVQRSRNSIVRGALAYREGDVKNVIRGEYGEVNGDGVVSQNHFRTPIGSKDVTQDNPGLMRAHWAQVANDTRVSVPFGNGEIVNIAAYRKLTSTGGFDTDSTEYLLFHQINYVDQSQYSNELRYTGTFNRFDVSAGVFGYADELDFVEDRVLALGATRVRGGGHQRSRTIAEFASVDFRMTDELTLSVGQRYSVEWKKADIQPILSTSTSPCSLTGCSAFRFPDNKEHWGAFTPRVAVQWEPAPATNLYAFYTKGFRSGGYNLRKATIQFPAPYDQEVVNSVEVGLKQMAFDGGLTANFAVFENRYQKLQRDVQIIEPALGSIQLTVNAADVRIRGVESEVAAQITPHITVSSNVGYLDSRFTKILFDLSGNGTIGPEDYALRLPFLSKWSYGLALNADYDTAVGALSSRISWSHRGDIMTIDNNTGKAPALDLLDAHVGLKFGSGLELAVYGRNLLDRPDLTYNNPLTLNSNSPLGIVRTTFSPIAKGRLYGVNLEYTFK